MSTLSERQAELEYESVVMGASRYDQQRKDQGESETLPGQEQTKRAVKPLSQAIAEFVEEAAVPGKAGRKHSALPYLLHIHPDQAAYLTIRHAIDGAAARRKVNTVAIAIGSAIEDHINLVNLRNQEYTDSEGNTHKGALYAKVMEQVKKATSERHRKGVLRHVVTKYTVDSLSWATKEKMLLGTKLIELFEDACNLVTLQRQTEGTSDTPILLVFTKDAEEWLGESHERARFWAPIHLPMLVPPRDWTSPFNGGYLTKAIRGAKMVLSHTKGYLDELRNIDMPHVYNAVNAIQRTPWAINKAVLDVMHQARAMGPRFESLFVEADAPLPTRPAGIPEDVSVDKLSIEQREVFKSWKRDAAKVYEENARRTSSRIGLAKKLYVADKFKVEQAIYFPHYLDFRGRIYPFANYLNPQGDDVAKGLLQFANGKPLGSRGGYWLMVHIANLFGVDKVSFEDRVKWVEEHTADILASALTPFECEFWTTADSPWCALAACLEFAGWRVQGDEYVSHLPIAMDGSCSGLQHYSAMLRDPVGGSEVNLVPRDKPGDIYTAVAKRAQSIIDLSSNGEVACWKGKVNRKIAKQPTMTLCYAATVFGMKGQIESAVRKQSENGIPYLGEGVDVHKASLYAAQVIWDAIGETVVAARQAMDFLKTIAKLAASEGLPIRWTAPSGFPVVQEYKQMLGERIRVHYQGRDIKLMLTKDGDKLDKKRQASGVAPNFVHAADSSHLMATVNMGVENDLQDWACIHDSFGVHAADVDVLHACIREAFIEQYTPNVLAEFRADIAEQLSAYAPELVEKLPPVPEQGTLDLAAVREARYFFA